MLLPQSKTSAGQMMPVVEDSDISDADDGDEDGGSVVLVAAAEEEVEVLPGQINAVQAGTPPSWQTQ